MGKRKRDIVEEMRDRQGILSEIKNFFTLGYGTKEDLRELDKMLRDLYYTDLKRLRHLWEDIYLAVLEADVKAPTRDLKKVIQVMDRVMEKIHHADYGYAGLFDRKGSIREEELAGILNYDRELGTRIDSLKDEVEKVQSYVESENWGELPANVRRVKDLLLSLEDRWIERERRFRPLRL